MEHLSFLGKVKIDSSTGLKGNVISEIENYFQLSLPLAYKEFLLVFGSNNRSFMGSYYMSYPSLMENKKDVIEMINFDGRKSESQRPILKSSYLFFGQWQGYNFFFFECGHSDNPPVKILNDSFEIINYKNSFTEFLIDEGIENIL